VGEIVVACVGAQCARLCREVTCSIEYLDEIFDANGRLSLIRWRKAPQICLPVAESGLGYAKNCFG
jgi:hypothetical protein